ncbi:hypothetical protein CRE_09633 [Caenorhabditis remanei]|uniref:BTB domain-containing protein n=1 Tax=Caenorhabditis remanei TaxID=31234 RepID=E3MJ27_CAERE|nr:hypothetical protein CRE_09633 [Caenorhabditis remanei]
MNRNQPTIPRKKFIVRDLFSKLGNANHAVIPIGVYFNYQLLLAIRIIDEIIPRAELTIKCNNLNEETTQFSFYTDITLSTGYRLHTMWTEKYFNEKSNEIVIDWEHVLIYRNLQDFRADLEVSFCYKRIDFENIWVSNIIIKVGNFNFNLIKAYLIMQCDYFQAMFSGNFIESDQKVVDIKGIDPYDFQNFLDVLHDDRIPILERHVAGILELATFFGARKVITSCEEFLLTKGYKSLKLAFQLSYKYNMEKLKKKCLNFVCCHEEFKIVRPENLDSLTREDINQLFETSLQLQSHSNCSSLFVHSPRREPLLIVADFLPYPRPDSATGFESLRQQRERIFGRLMREEGGRNRGPARNEPSPRNRMGQNRNPPRGIPNRDQLRGAGPDGLGRGNHPIYVPFNHHPHAPPRNEPNPNYRLENEFDVQPLHGNRNHNNQDGMNQGNVRNQVNDLDREPNVAVPAPHPPAIVENNNQNDESPSPLNIYFNLKESFDYNHFAILFFTFSTLLFYFKNNVALPDRLPLYASIICLFVNVLFRLFCMK